MPSEPSHVPFVRSVLHPTDFSAESDTAFVHALAIALRRDTELTLLHAGAGDTRSSWTRFPPVRATLEAWGLLEAGGSPSSVLDGIGIKVRKHLIQGGNVLSGALDYLDRHPAELIVLATAGREGLARWWHPSVAERLARRAETATLFVPRGVGGFFSRETGRARLRRIVVPVDHSPAPAPALSWAARAAESFGGEAVEITVLHVGREAPRLRHPESRACQWTDVIASGDVVGAILREVREREGDLIVMATEGHHGVLDALRGSVTEQVLRRAPCPVLAIPARASPMPGPRAIRPGP